MKVTVLFLSLTLFAGATAAQQDRAQDQAQAQAATAPAPTVFMGHTLGETVQQWLDASGNTDVCPKHRSQNKDFCDSVDAVAAGQYGKVLTQHPGDANANDVWWFDGGSLGGLVAIPLPFTLTLQQIHDRYGEPTRKGTKTEENRDGTRFDVTTLVWDMPDGTFIDIVGQEQGNRCKLSISTHDFVQKERDAANPF
jgi:hypothetical protein